MGSAFPLQTSPSMVKQVVWIALTIIFVGFSASGKTSNSLQTIFEHEQRFGRSNTYSRTTIEDAYTQYLNDRGKFLDTSQVRGSMLSPEQLKRLIANFSTAGKLSDYEVYAVIERTELLASDLENLSNIYQWLVRPAPQSPDFEGKEALDILFSRIEHFRKLQKTNQPLPKDLFESEWSELMIGWEVWGKWAERVPRVEGPLARTPFPAIDASNNVSRNDLIALLKRPSPKGAIADYFDERMQNLLLQEPAEVQQTWHGVKENSWINAEPKSSIGKLYREWRKEFNKYGTRKWREVFVPNDSAFLDCEKRLQLWKEASGSKSEEPACTDEQQAAEDKANEQIAAQLLSDHDETQLVRHFSEIGTQIGYNETLLSQMMVCLEGKWQSRLACLGDATSLQKQLKIQINQSRGYQQGLTGVVVQNLEEQRLFILEILADQIPAMEKAYLFLAGLNGEDRGISKNGHIAKPTPGKSWFDLRLDVNVPEFRLPPNSNEVPFSLVHLQEEQEKIVSSLPSDLERHRRAIQRVLTGQWKQMKPSMMRQAGELRHTAKQAAEKLSQVAIEPSQGEKSPTLEGPDGDQLRQFLSQSGLSATKRAYLFANVPKEKLPLLASLYSALHTSDGSHFSSEEAIYLAGRLIEVLEKRYPEAIPASAISRVKKDLQDAHSIWNTELANGDKINGRNPLLNSTSPTDFRRIVRENILQGQAVAPAVAEFLNQSAEEIYFANGMAAINRWPVLGGYHVSMNGQEYDVPVTNTHFNETDFRYKIPDIFPQQYSRWKPIYESYRDRPWPMYQPLDAEIDQLPNYKKQLHAGTRNLHYRRGDTVYNIDMDRAYQAYDNALRGGAGEEEIGRNLMLAQYRAVHQAKHLEEFFRNMAKAAEENDSFLQQFARCSDSPYEYVKCVEDFTEEKVSSHVAHTEKLLRRLEYARQSPPFQRPYYIFQPLIAEQLNALRLMEAWVSDRKGLTPEPEKKETSRSDQLPFSYSFVGLGLRDGDQVAMGPPPDAIIKGGVEKPSGPTVIRSGGGGLFPPSMEGPKRAEAQAVRAQLAQELPGKVNRSSIETTEYLQNIQSGFEHQRAGLEAQASFASDNARRVAQMMSRKEPTEYRTVTELVPGVPEEWKQTFAKDLKQSADFMDFLHKNPQLVNAYSAGNLFVNGETQDPFLQKLEREAKEFEAGIQYLEGMRSDPGVSAFLEVLGPIQKEARNMRAVAALAHAARYQNEANAVASLHSYLTKELGEKIKLRSLDVLIGVSPLGDIQAVLEASTGKNLSGEHFGDDLSQSQYHQSFISALLALGGGKALSTLSKAATILRGGKGIGKVADAALTARKMETAFHSAASVIPEIRTLDNSAAAMLSRNLAEMGTDGARQFMTLAKDKILSPGQVVMLSELYKDAGKAVRGAGGAFLPKQFDAFSESIHKYVVKQTTSTRALDAVGQLDIDLRNAERWRTKNLDREELYLQSWNREGIVGTGITNEEIILYRVHSTELNQKRPWMLTIDPRIATKEEVASKLALPSGVEGMLMVTEVKVPAGTPFMVGTVGKSAAGQGGAIQIKILNELPNSAYGIPQKWD